MSEYKYKFINSQKPNRIHSVHFNTVDRTGKTKLLEYREYTFNTKDRQHTLIEVYDPEHKDYKRAGNEDGKSSLANMASTVFDLDANTGTLSHYGTAIDVDKYKNNNDDSIISNITGLFLHKLSQLTSGKTPALHKAYYKGDLEGEVSIFKNLGFRGAKGRLSADKSRYNFAEKGSTTKQTEEISSPFNEPFRLFAKIDKNASEEE